METNELAPKKLRPRLWWPRAIRLKVQGIPVKEIARRCDVSPRTLDTFFAGDYAKQEMRDLTDSIAESTGSDSVSVKIKKALPAAIEKLIAKLHCGDDKVEFLAACRLLDNAGFAPVKRIHISEEERLRDLTPTEMRHYAETGQLPARMATIEAIAHANGTGDDN